MNQIILSQSINTRQQRFFRIQLVVSIVILIVLSLYGIDKWRERQETQQISQMVNQAFEVETVYQAASTSFKSNPYLGKIIIPKIDLEYSVFDTCNDELLKILPCRFAGPGIGEKGNICIAGHNYNDARFFGKLSHLEKNDTVYLQDLAGEIYQYVVCDKYKVSPDNLDCVKQTKMYELTLLTCDNVNHKRWVIKAAGENF